MLAIFDTWETFWAESREAVLIAGGTIVLVATIAVGAYRRSVIAAFGTFALGALLWMLMFNTDSIRDDFEDDLVGAGVELVVPGLTQ